MTFFPNTLTVGPQFTGAQFRTLGQAYTAAKTLNPTLANQILVRVFPGNYDEQLVLDKPFVHFQALPSDRGFATLVEQGLVVDMEGAIDDRFNNVVNLVGLQFNGVGLRCTGSRAQAIFAKDCRFQGPNVLDNDGTDPGGRSTQVVARDCTFASVSADAPALDLDAGQLDGNNCDILAESNDARAVDQAAGTGFVMINGNVRGTALHDGALAIARWYLTTHTTSDASPWDVRSVAAVQLDHVQAVTSGGVTHVIGSAAGGVTIVEASAFPGPFAVQSGGGLVVLDQRVRARVQYAPATPGDWAAPAPTTVQEALDRLAAANPGA